ncbi:radical SAM domain protein [Peptoclostridium acidaminophilum DSM 3953]|uniref:Radical SAM domain protein n=1 Tax=Peptoclostridium acidaminophilum DSM 3953 TaxID=1286171 RepID=W8U5L1_PEPAC|nr:B12-binding domain-containing radical SAM protein [Peptoclostridium acidaminophilum]AHM56216.1 radical SAM domain protein [Peptoclostridium acidaminophilum DSM 3953]
MKVVIASLNSKYIHTNLAIRYLKEFCGGIEGVQIEIAEYTINMDKDRILRGLFDKNADVVCFSCYIWNIESTLELAENLKKVAPGVKVILGGPEVSFESKQIMEECGSIDFVVSGEGELTLSELLTGIMHGSDLSAIEGLTFRMANGVVQNGARCPMESLDSVGSPYLSGTMEEFKDKIVYYESSRGCPFSCQYCMSSIERGVRYFDISRVKRELKIFLDAGIKQVKFIDRTFNASVKRAAQILRYLMENDNGYTNFHFEVAAHTIDEELLGIFKNARKGLFQIEIGIQSLNRDTLREIGRGQNFERIRNVVTEIAKAGRVHQHVDLIAGLPHESFESFRDSFNGVFDLGADNIQLGFLKLLKGAPISRSEKLREHGYVYRANPPYEVLQNKYISFEQLARLKEMEELLELYWNSHKFTQACSYIIASLYTGDAFKFFMEYAEYWHDKGYYEIGHSRDCFYRLLLEFCKHKDFGRTDTVRELLRFDYLSMAKTSRVPDFMAGTASDEFGEWRLELLRDEARLAGIIPEYDRSEHRSFARRVHIEQFACDIEALVESPNSMAGKSRQAALFVYPKANSGGDTKIYFINLD